MVEFFAGYYTRRRDVKKIKEKGAISKDTAKTSEELGLPKMTLEYLVWVKDIKKTEDNRYYVDCKDKKGC